jgi:hypothetical protein
MVGQQNLPTHTSDTIWCVRLWSTFDIHLVKSEMITLDNEPIKVEITPNGLAHIWMPYTNKIEAERMLIIWKQKHPEATIHPKSSNVVKEMPLLFTWD